MVLHCIISITTHVAGTQLSLKHCVMFDTQFYPTVNDDGPTNVLFVLQNVWEFALGQRFLHCFIIPLIGDDRLKKQLDKDMSSTGWGEFLAP